MLFIVLPTSQSKSNEKQQTTFTHEEKLEQTLQAMDGVGKVKVYFYYGQLSESADEANMFSQYFKGSSQVENNITGLLVVSEGAEDIYIQNEIRKIVSQVMQLPIHRIVIVPMEK
ncbi:MAG: hypothetical protein RR595_04650 [Lysinibacillus sp.]